MPPDTKVTPCARTESSDRQLNEVVRLNANRNRRFRALPGLIRGGEELCAKAWAADLGSSLDRRILAADFAASFKIDPEARLTPDVENITLNFGTLTALQDLPISVVIAVAKCVRRRSVRAHAEIVREGDPSEEWFILVSGKAFIEVSSAVSSEKDTPMAVLHKGCAFGEFGLLFDQPRTASVRASHTGAELAVLRKYDYQRLLGNFHSTSLFAALETKINFLTQWEAFAAFPRNALIALSYNLEFRVFKAEATLYGACPAPVPYTILSSITSCSRRVMRRTAADPSSADAPSLAFIISGSGSVWARPPGPIARHAGTRLVSAAARGYFFGRLCTPAEVLLFPAPAAHAHHCYRSQTTAEDLGEWQGMSHCCKQLRRRSSLDRHLGRALLRRLVMPHTTPDHFASAGQSIAPPTALGASQGHASARRSP
jgi:hypothetical protein